MQTKQTNKKEMGKGMSVFSEDRPGLLDFY